MVYELKIKDYFGVQNQILLDILQKDRARFEARLKEAVNKIAVEYLAGISIVISETPKFDGQDITLKVTTPD